MIAVIFVNKKPKWAEGYSQFAQNLMRGWECPDPTRRPRFESLGGGYGLIFYREGNEDFIGKMSNEKSIVIFVSSPRNAKVIYEKLYGHFVPYFSKACPLGKDRREQLKEGVEKDGGKLIHASEGIVLHF